MRTLLLLSVLAVGCATPYQQMGVTGGYAESQLAERVFEVRFAGNGYTHRADVEAYAMRRAAEVAIARGFAGFVEMKDDTSTDQSLSYTTKTNYASGASYEEPEVVSKHMTTKRVYLLTAEQLREVPTAMDARIVLSRWPSDEEQAAAE